MHISIGRAKNETVELIIGNGLIATGGILIGYQFADPSFEFMRYSAPILVVVGITVDVRVLKKFSYELKQQKDLLDESRKLLERTMTEMKQHRENLVEMEKKAFKFISQTSVFASLEDMINELGKRIQDIENRLGIDRPGRRRYY